MASAYILILTIITVINADSINYIGQNLSNVIIRNNATVSELLLSYNKNINITITEKNDYLLILQARYCNLHSFNDSDRLTKLMYLDLSYNFIKVVNLPIHNGYVINLSHNDITDIKLICNVKQVILSHNKIYNLSYNSFNNVSIINVEYNYLFCKTISNFIDKNTELHQHVTIHINKKCKVVNNDITYSKSDTSSSVNIIGIICAIIIIIIIILIITVYKVKKIFGKRTHSLLIFTPNTVKKPLRANENGKLITKYEDNHIYEDVTVLETKDVTVPETKDVTVPETKDVTVPETEDKNVTK